MNRSEYLLTCLAEEANEVGQGVAKALRFGLAETEPGQPSSNAERVVAEVSDLLGVYLILRDEGVLPPIDFRPQSLSEIKSRKLEKIEHFM